MRRASSVPAATTARSRTTSSTASIGGQVRRPIALCSGAPTAESPYSDHIGADAATLAPGHPIAAPHRNLVAGEGLDGGQLRPHRNLGTVAATNGSAPTTLGCRGRSTASLRLH